MAKSEYYSLDKIKKQNAMYNIIMSGRSSGKSAAAYTEGLKVYLETGKQMALIRRYQDDFIGKRGVMMFADLVNRGVVSELSGGRWTDITYYSSKWYLCTYDPDKGDRIRDQEPFCFGFSISAMEHDKSTQYPKICTIVFDEFIARNFYLDNEFVLFMNVLSTIIRHRTDVKIYMLGNLVNKYCPYFSEMGLSHVKDMKPGTIEVYKYGKSSLTVAVEYAENKISKTSKSSEYFAFDNPRLQMITGEAWEISIYPHCPQRYPQTDVVFMYFIIWDGDIIQCEIVFTEGMTFTFCHRKTGEIKYPDKDLIFSKAFNPKPNYRRNIAQPVGELGRKIFDYFRREKVYYADNEVGEIVRNYLAWCGWKKEVDR